MDKPAVATDCACSGKWSNRVGFFPHNISPARGTMILFFQEAFSYL